MSGPDEAHRAMDDARQAILESVARTVAGLEAHNPVTRAEALLQLAQAWDLCRTLADAGPKRGASF